MTKKRLYCGILAMTAVMSACKDESPLLPAAVSPVNDVALTGTAGDLLSPPIAVRVVDASGSPLAGQIVTFALVEGGGSVVPALDTTDFSGIASTGWRLGERAGLNRITASVAGLTNLSTFVATGRAGAPSTASISAGDNQTSAVGAVVPTAPSVLVRDRFSNPVSGVTVLFSVALGGGALASAAPTTNASGVATLGEWRLGPTVGANRLTASVVANGVGGNPITFNASATAGAPASVTATNVQSISAVVATQVTPIPQVRVTDANGNPIAGATVNFAASAGSSVAGATKLTDAQGFASPDSWLLGTTAQNYTLSAVVGTLSPVTFTAQARPSAPSSMAIVAGNTQTASVGRTLPIDPSVRVTDAFNNPVTGVEVTFEVTGGAGTAVARRQLTNAQGVATVGAWTLGDEVGANTLRASVTAPVGTVPPVTFQATATPGAPATITVFSGSGQSGSVGTALLTPPSVIVRDVRGNPVPNVSVTWIPATNSGTVGNPSSVTAVNGVATSGTWTLGATIGTQSLTARIAGLPDVVITATATPGAPANVGAVSNANLGDLVVALSQAAPTLPSVRVTDVQGNPVPGITVQFSTGNGTSGTILGGTQTTNSNGVATLTAWTLPTTAGIASVIATVDGLLGVTFTANMLPAAATRFALVSAPSSVSLAAQTSVFVTVRLQDVFFNTVPSSGQVVTGTAGANSGTGGASATLADGTATLVWNLNTTMPLTTTQTFTLTFGSFSTVISLTVLP